MMRLAEKRLQKSQKKARPAEFLPGALFV